MVTNNRKAHQKRLQNSLHEKKARGETANSPEARIADFRAKIADRKAETGKEYLSFYFMEANSYEVE